MFSLQATDTGKSPLALLAQTCNSIGLPDSQSKSKATILPATDKPSTSPSTKRDDKSIVKTDHPLEQKSPKVSNSASSGKSHRDHRNGSVDENANRTDRPSTSCKDEQRPSSSATAGHDTRTSTAGESSIGHSSQAIPPTFTSTSRCFPGLNTHPYAAALPYAHLGLPSAGVNPFAHYFPSSPYAGLPFGLPPTPSAALAAAAATSRPCLDPGCKGCPGRAPAAPAACPLGCNSCTSHMPSSSDLSNFWLNYASLLYGGGSSSSLATSMGMSLPNHLAAAAAAAAVTSTPSVAATPVPVAAAPTTACNHVCYWVVAEGQMCNKRFSTSEELMNHMKSHATPDQQPTPTQAAVSVSSAATASLPASSANPFLPLTAGGRISPRSYLSAAFRFHPYAPKLSPTGASPLTPHLPFPTISPNGYSAVTALYGQRLPGSLPHS